MSTTRKRKVLSLEQKLEVCRLVENGESFRKIAESCGVGLSTVSDIYRSRRQLHDFVSLMDASTVYLWFLQKRALDQPISGPILQEKALDFNTKLSIDNFLSADSESAAKFTATLNDFIRKEGEQWLADDDTPLFETLTDEEILNAVKKDENEDKDESDMPDKPTERLSHSEAYSCLKFSLQWMEQQNEFSATQLMVVRHICDIAAQKKLSSLKQKLITDFIEYDAK
ncbi:Jerky protein [Trichinella britovi]|uniref:Jerky protein n=1 Tax=Trichinella britovi TaxID=45882 RepID=A0A0V1CGH4_TRIBR|nr:Jerky protein [Trichinella britovi]